MWVTEALFQGILLFQDGMPLLLLLVDHSVHPHRRLLLIRFAVDLFVAYVTPQFKFVVINFGFGGRGRAGQFVNVEGRLLLLPIKNKQTLRIIASRL